MEVETVTLEPAPSQTPLPRSAIRKAADILGLPIPDAEHEILRAQTALPGPDAICARHECVDAFRSQSTVKEEPLTEEEINAAVARVQLQIIEVGFDVHMLAMVDLEVDPMKVWDIWVTDPGAKHCSLTDIHNKDRAVELRMSGIVAPELVKGNSSRTYSG